MHKRAVNTTGPVDSRAGTTCFLAGHDCASEALKGGGKKKKRKGVDSVEAGCLHSVRDSESVHRKDNNDESVLYPSFSPLRLQ